ncbi:aminoglycoside N(3)-acetyltransferase [Streptomyces sp. NPDC004822]|uniref:aminoglycoside N(3)-acetyltransferase n=1 Tax=Streptomyces sp. SS1-1 TaxID=2651869 RepID=UPI001CEF7C64|nr:AAC(3) family N-acetyltransferase [Streptomyces sp. SS1-1]
MTSSSLARDLVDLGLRPGTTVLAHASLRRVGAADEDLLAALLDVLGPRGTLVVPAFTAGNSDTSPAYRDRVRGLSTDQIRSFKGRMPPFDPASTPSEGVGRLAEAVRRSGGAVRSAHPQTSFAALGARATELLAGHAENCHLGERSPLRGLYEADAHVLLLGVGFEVCSAFHLAEYRVPDPPRRTYRCVVLRDGARRWIAYEDVDLDDGDFGVLGADFEKDDAAHPDPVVRGGRVGDSHARLFPLARAVDFAAGWLAGNRSRRVPADPSQNGAVFLH